MRRQPPPPRLSPHLIYDAASHSRVSPSPAPPLPPQSCARRHQQPHRARHDSPPPHPRAGASRCRARGPLTRFLQPSRALSVVFFSRSWRPGAPEVPIFGAHVLLLVSLISLGAVAECGPVAGWAATGSVQVRCNLSGAANNNNQAVRSDRQCTGTRQRLSCTENNNNKRQRPTTISSVIMMQPLMITRHIHRPLIFPIL